MSTRKKPTNGQIADGRGHRIATTDDRPGHTAGFYILHNDGLPAGYVRNHRSGEERYWHARQPQRSPEEMAHLKAHMANQSYARARAREEQYTQAARRVREHLRGCDLLSPGDATPYLGSKGVRAHGGVFSDPNRRWTYLPIYDLNGNLSSVQSINPQGVKRFAAQSQVEGHCHVLGGLSSLLRTAQQDGVAVLAEGYATAASVADALASQGPPTVAVAAFNASNLVPVAKALRARYPKLPVIIAGDDDRTRKVNVGRHKALQAAAAVGGQAVFPPFTAQHPKELSDWNDLLQRSPSGEAVELLRRSVREAQATHDKGQAATLHQNSEPNQQDR